MNIKTICRYCLKLFTDDELYIKKNGQASNSCLGCWDKYYKMKRNDTNVCGNCRIHCQGGFGIKPNGEAYKSCPRCRASALKSHEKNRCLHGRKKCQCKDCGGTSICEHQRRRNTCKACNKPIEVTIKQWIRSCRQSDKNNNRFDADHNIDTDFLRGLIEDYETCFYEDCKVKLQYINYGPDLATIERIDNTKGHIKSNCVLCCKSCNNKKKSNKFVDNKNPN